jgi:sugar lactone lactonase YvrE
LTVSIHACDIVGRARDRLGEVPVWSVRDRCLWWVDVLSPTLRRYAPAAGEHASWPIPVRSLGCVALRAGGGLILGTDMGVLAFDPRSAASSLLVQPEPDKPTHRLNDGRCDRRGRLWVGSMNERAFVPEGTLFRVDADLSVHPMLDQIKVPNSIAFSPDDRTLYFADTRACTIWRFDFDVAEGRISNRRVFAESGAPARPDGACVDADGFLWSAHFAGACLVRYAPDGRVDRVVDLPVRNPTSCCFGGENLDILFVTSASDAILTGTSPSDVCGRLISLQVGSRGLPEPVFGARSS